MKNTMRRTYNKVLKSVRSGRWDYSYFFFSFVLIFSCNLWFSTGSFNNQKSKFKVNIYKGSIDQILSWKLQEPTLGYWNRRCVAAAVWLATVTEVMRSLGSQAWKAHPRSISRIPGQGRGRAMGAASSLQRGWDAVATGLTLVASSCFLGNIFTFYASIFARLYAWETKLTRTIL